MPNWLSRISPYPRLVGDAQCPGTWIEPLRVIYDHELVLFRDGEFVVEFEDASFPCVDGSFIVVPPGRPHVSRATSQTGGHRYWVHLDWMYQPDDRNTPLLTYLPGSALPELYRPAPAFVPKGILYGAIRSAPAAFDLYGRLLALVAQNTERADNLARARLLELLVEVLGDSNASPSPSPAGATLPARVRELLDQIAHLSLNDMPSIQTYLEQLDYSYAHLCRCFRDAYGVPPVQYLTALRIERAKLFIRDTQIPFADIARRVGYDSPAYFCRQFRRLTGISPTEYARMSRS